MIPRSLYEDRNEESYVAKNPEAQITFVRSARSIQQLPIA